MGKNWKGLRPTHPGELLREELMPAISADMAHRLARLLDTTPEFWLGLQQDVDLWNARQEADGEYQKIKPLRKPA